MGIEPELIYFDGDKSGNDIDVAHKLFSSAIISGDDWNWGIFDDYPIHRSVKKFSADHNFVIRVNRAKWMLVSETELVIDFVNKVDSLLKDIVRAMKNFIKPFDSEVIC